MFKLDSMYKDITAYLDGLTNIIIYVEKLNREENRKLHIFLYYDHSLDYDEKFLKIKNNILADIKNKKSCVSLFEYKKTPVECIISTVIFGLILERRSLIAL